MNTVVILGKRITLRPNAADRPGRTVGYRSVPLEASGGREGAKGWPRAIHPQMSEAIPGKVPSRGTPSDGPGPMTGNSYPNVAPTSRRIIDRGLISGRLSTGGALPGYPTPLDTGLPPKRIRRLTRAQDHGAVTAGTGTGVTGGLGYNITSGSVQTIPHIRIPRTPITVTAFRRTVDTTSGIPAKGIASPLR